MPGEFVYTTGIDAKGSAFVNASVAAVVSYDDFHPDIDPYGTHEMGRFEIAGETVWFKIDDYDENYVYGSDDPTDLGRTRRVLTIRLSHEY